MNMESERMILKISHDMGNDQFFEKVANGPRVRWAITKWNLQKHESAPLARTKTARAKSKMGRCGAEGQLTVDVYQTPSDIFIESAIAGVKPEDIDVNVTNDSISIKGARHAKRRVATKIIFTRNATGANSPAR